MNRKWILPVVLIVLALAIGTKLAANKKQLDAAKQPIDRSGFAIPVTVFAATDAPVSGTFSVPGSLEPYDHAKVMVNAQGKLASLSVDLGSRVTKGQVMGSLDVAQRQLELNAAELSLDKLQKDNDRYKDLYEGKAASEVNYDDARFQYQNAKVKVDQIKQQIQDARIVSPVTGTVVAKGVQLGEFVNAGTMVVEVVDVTRLKAKVYVSERDAYRVQEGQAVKVTSEVFPGEVFAGKVTFISPRGDASHNYEVEVAMDNTKVHPLKSGTFINATFDGGDGGHALLIPKNALGEGLKDPFIYVVNGTPSDSTARVSMRKITLGREVGDDVEVLDGLKAGETVVLSGQLNLTEGSLVQVAAKN